MEGNCPLRKTRFPLRTAGVYAPNGVGAGGKVMPRVVNDGSDIGSSLSWGDDESAALRRLLL
jgi:hypothetical protein